VARGEPHYRVSSTIDAHELALPESQIMPMAPGTTGVVTPLAPQLLHNGPSPRSLDTAIDMQNLIIQTSSANFRQMGPADRNTCYILV
jgi:hypothetical protein